jgi:hypothetical protein
MLTIGERLWNGAIVTPQLAAAYNKRLRMAQAWRDMGRDPPVELANGLHNLIASAR